MKSRVLNLLLILASLVGYLEWGGGKKAFLFQVEAEVLSKLLTDPASVIHPFTMLPMAGQLLLFWTLFQKVPGKLLTYIGIAGIGILLAFMFVIGLISLNAKIVLSTAPFLILGFMRVRHSRNI